MNNHFGIKFMRLPGNWRFGIIAEVTTLVTVRNTEYFQAWFGYLRVALFSFSLVTNPRLSHWKRCPDVLE